jgi:hypothetical protein
VPLYTVLSVGALSWAAISPQALFAIIAGALVLAGYFVWQWDAKRRVAQFEYTLTPQAAVAWLALQKATNELMTAGRLALIDSVAANPVPGTASGASVERRTPIDPCPQTIPSIRTNVGVAVIDLGHKALCFLPDVLLVIGPGYVDSFAYSDLQMKLRRMRFVETDPVPGDATIVGKTWRYVRQDGGRDERFTDNAEIPIVEYEELWLTAGTVLNDVIQVSAIGRAEELAHKIRDLSGLTMAPVLVS